LIQPHYLEAYCSITNGMGGRLASENIPKLKEIQEFYRARGGIFIELITPSKVAQMPEAFINRFPCENSPDARVQFLPQYVESLREAGINVVDAAGLIHSLKGRDPVGLFPQGGVHWNELAAARAVSVLVEEINRRAATKLIPSFDFTYDVSPVAGGMDQDLAELLNVFFPPLNYSTPKVKFVRSASCPDSPSLAIEVAVVGDSFSHRVSRILIEQNCLYGLNFYYYWHALFGGFPYRKIREGLVRADISRLRDAKIMIFEENESFLGRADLESLRKTLIH
jgi:alginate O-acetyltransferase complex protein AlgJ